MNTERADEIRDRIRNSPKEIRVLCPHGHFIADIAVEVPDGEVDIALWPRGPHKRHNFDRHTGFYGFWMSLAQRRAPGVQRAPDVSVRLKCTNRRCAYTGKFGYLPLAVELAAAALAGHAEHRLTV